MIRRVIQIVAMDEHDANSAGIVLCNDNTAWRKDYSYHPPKWVSVKLLDGEATKKPEPRPLRYHDSLRPIRPKQK